MDVSVIIVNYNTKDLLYNCIKSIFEKTSDVQFEIIVVDNASIDGTQEMVLQKFPEVNLIQSKENLGFGKANNLGAKSAKGKYLFLLNSDTELKNNAIKIFFHYMETHNVNYQIGAIGCLLINKDKSYCHSYGKFPSVLDNRYIRSKEDLKEKTVFEEGKIDFSVEYITGADLFMPKSIFDEFDGFDKDYFMYYEETDLQYRMAQKNYIRRIISGPEIYHLESGSFYIEDNLLDYRKAISDISLNIFLKKNYSKMYYCIFKFYFYLIKIKQNLVR